MVSGLTVATVCAVCNQQDVLVGKGYEIKAEVFLRTVSDSTPLIQSDVIPKGFLAHPALTTFPSEAVD